MLTAALCAYAVGYRFYARFIARRIFALDDARPTPAVRLNDGHDFVPTSKWVVFGHHFAAIAGAGPLVGPVLAAGWQKLFSPQAKIGFLAQARAQDEIATRLHATPAPSEAAAADARRAAIAKAERLRFSNRLNAGLCAAFLLIILAIMVDTVRACWGSCGPACAADRAMTPMSATAPNTPATGTPSSTGARSIATISTAGGAARAVARVPPAKPRLAPLPPGTYPAGHAPPTRRRPYPERDQGSVQETLR